MITDLAHRTIVTRELPNLELLLGDISPRCQFSNIVFDLDIVELSRATQTLLAISQGTPTLLSHKHTTEESLSCEVNMQSKPRVKYSIALALKLPQIHLSTARRSSPPIERQKPNNAITSFKVLAKVVSARSPPQKSVLLSSTVSAGGLPHNGWCWWTCTKWLVLVVFLKIV